MASIGIIAFFTIAILAIEQQQAQAEKSPYDSGHDHGCSDAGKDPDDRYINQDGKGPSEHTNEFMDGYNDGYDSCSGNSDSGDNNNNNDQSQAQTQENENENKQNTCVTGATCYFD